MISTAPFFILANPRSGSSLLRIICESHSQLCVPPESGFMEWWYPKYRDWNRVDSTDNQKVNLFVNDLLTSKKIETWNFDRQFLISLIQKEQPKNYPELIALIYLAFGLKNFKKTKVWGDKNNYYIHKTDLLHKLYPRAKYIHLVRDGRDVATSYIALKDLKTDSGYAPKLATNVEEIAKEWNHNNMLLLSFFQTINKDNVHRIRYEDLISNLKSECLKITDFLDVPFEKDMLDYYVINKTKKIEPSQTLDWKKKTLEKPDTDAIGKYKRMLSDKEIAIFNNIAKEGLIEFGYE